MKFLIHLVTIFSPAHYFFSSSHEEELCDSEALRRNGTCSVHYSWPCFQLRFPARQMSAACDKQPVSSLRKLGWSGEVCRRKDTLCPGINIRKVADLGIFFLIAFTNNKGDISSVARLASIPKICYQLGILIHLLHFQQMSSFTALSLRLGK